MIRPIKIFLYYALIAALVAIIHWWLKDNGISLIPDFSHHQQTQKQDSTAFELLPNEVIASEDSLSNFANDTLKEVAKPNDPELKTVDSLLTAPPQFRKLFARFCQRAGDFENTHGNPIRIIHIGDSQIEADRITGILRNHFQSLYGGSGPGFILPFDPLRINATVQLSNGGSWHLEYSYRENNYPHPLDFGFSGKIAWFEGNEGQFRISPHPWKSKKLQTYPNIKLLTTGYSDTIRMKVSSGAQVIHRTSVPPTKRLSITPLKPDFTYSELNFQFTTETGSSPVFHGLTLDGDSGVAVDNISMRGRPWPGFRLADQQLLKDMGQKLNVGLIIIQFGTNVLPTKTDDYNFYRVHFYRELKKLQNILPDIPVLVVGVQASAESQNGKITPMEHALGISNAQKSATLACNMAFYDLHKMMGGKNGAIEWANQEPPLMLQDYMHFSNRGARKTGNQIWESLNSLRREVIKQDAMRKTR